MFLSEFSTLTLREIQLTFCLKAALWTCLNRARDAAFKWLDSCTLNRLRQATKGSKREDEMAREMMYGEVIWFDPKLGYGFVRPDGFKKDVFLHISNARMVGAKNGIVQFYYNFPIPQEYLNVCYPEKGDRLVFCLSKGKGDKLKCSPWCVERAIDEVVETLARYGEKERLEVLSVYEFLESCPICHEPRSFYGQLTQFCDCDLDEWEAEQEDFREVRLSDSPMGMTIYE